VELILYDLLGRRVRRLVSEFQEAGSHQVAWDGADDRGRVTASGVYLYRLKAVDQQLSRRLLLVR
jgi:flagellar hook assembly protein FlgD